MKSDYFSKKLNNIAEIIWHEIEKDFDLYDNHCVEKIYPKKTKFGECLYTHIIQSKVIQLNEFRIKFGIDDSIRYSFSFNFDNNEIVIPNKKEMKKVSSFTIQYVKQNYIDAIKAKLKLEGATALLDMRKKKESLARSIFTGPIIKDECATPGGGSVDFVYFVPMFNIFKE